MMESLLKIPKRITLILEKLNHAYMNDLANNFISTDEDEKFSYTRVVNKSIDFQRMLIPEIKFDTSESYKEKILELRELRNNADYDKQTYYNQLISQYEELYKILQEEEDIDLSLPIRKWQNIKNGHAIIPKDWVFLKAFGPLEEQEYILVIECRNGQKHGNVPHFYLASDCRRGCEVTDEMTEEIYSEIAKVYEPFAELRRRDVESNKLPDLHANIEQLEAWDKEPHFGIFSVPVAGDNAYYNYTTGKYKYPAGAYVVHEEK